MSFIPDLETARKFYPIPKSFEFSTLKPAFELAEANYLQELLGDVFWGDIPGIIAEDPLPGSTKRKFLDSLFSAIVHLGLYHHLPKKNVIITDNGVQINKTENQVSAFPWQVKQLLNQLHADGFLAINQVILLLEQYPGEFSSWHSTVFEQNKRYFLRNAKEFNTYYHIHRNVSLFYELIPVMSRVEEDRVLPVVGTELFEALKSDMENAQYKEIIAKIRFAVAYLTIGEGAIQSYVRFGPKGIQVSKGNTSAETPELEEPAGAAFIDALTRSCEKVGEAQLASLRSLLLTKAAAGELDIYKNSAAYLPDFEPKPYEGDHGYSAI